MSGTDAQAIDRFPAFLRDVIVIVARQQRRAARMVEQAIDGWKFAQQARGLVGHEESEIYTGWGQIQLESSRAKCASNSLKRLVRTDAIF